MTALTPCLDCKVIDVVRSCSSCWKQVIDGDTATSVRFWYFFTDVSKGYLPRSKLGSWIWEKGALQTDGQYANLEGPRPWFSGRREDLPAGVPCRTCPDTCGIFYGWPLFTRADVHVEEVGGPGVWDYTGVPIAWQDPTTIEVDHLTTGTPIVAATYNREHCRSAMYQWDATPLAGGAERETLYPDPAYVFTSYSTAINTLRLTNFPVTTVNCFWRIRWFADP